MYYLAIRQFARSLKNLDAILGKAVSHAEARKFDVNNYCGVRLFPDMLPFANQIRIATDMAKAAAANLSGKEAPKFEDNETTIEQLRARVRRCIGFLEGFSAADFEKVSPKTLVKIPYPAGKAVHADEYLFGRQIPNFFFHVTTAYNLLRQGGVDIGKNDFIGELALLEA
ncbi:MAG TPA: DUF1993 domain-containing protein [Polyangiaceae bacterium]|nr:DUF1993 domain-containing protein [Polyangiaceae bacterium]